MAKRKCRFCRGRGEVDIDGDVSAVCLYCDGEGEGDPCPVCKGTGNSPERPWTFCGDCGGSGLDQTDPDEKADSNQAP